MSEALISLRGVGKSFTRGSTSVTALRDIDLDVAQGQVYAVIGYSGAGKSTLVRLINGLEQPTSGAVLVEGKDLTSLSAKEIRQVRSRIGMVFQQFNLFGSRTVFANIAYPLQLAGWSKEQQQKRVAELLTFVGLTDKAWAYPEELSGGQKQRIGIARALATNPPILLADEATSALDPDTTQDVLRLLRRVNEELGVTIVVITHEMDVVRSLADHVAVLDDGRLVESGPVREILAQPKAATTRRFLDATLRTRPGDGELARLRETYDGVLVTVAVPDQHTIGGLLTDVVRDHDVSFEIVHGGYTTIKDESIGTFTIALQGDSTAVERAVEALSGAATVEVAA
ncbi:methionine ABC transporter ATP-binding protein [Luteipulveratus mongoliensis]|uniref:Methionine ABC transporter ATP-binding protein n=1 Tax=Luteipulveratus mongoliensis TaxID=571913 RepID=A0A0K1JMT9_9MICO|nr:methionine ABC transporter ATP-binding protein [Luteipulveratus mongoliensis]AKU17898.1 methionine ABC transporter ATP-binding protein [Luteipulveratus mongoliensis]